jgi:hypothetical protein
MTEPTTAPADPTLADFSLDLLADYAEAVKVDTATLERDLELLPAQLLSVGQKLLAATRNHLTAKSLLEQIRANAYMQIRRQRALAGVRTSEAEVEAEIVQDTNVRNATELVNSYAIQIQRWRIAQDAIKAKASAIELLMRLRIAEVRGANYSPSI